MPARSVRSTSFGHLDRRQFLQQIGALGAGAQLAVWSACGKSDTAGAGTPVGDANAALADPNGTIHSAIDVARWASGGTAMMAATYPDPFTAVAAGTCVATCQATAGPCYLADGLPPERQDISEGQPGLPMVLGLRILGGDCEPITGAQVELWHTNASGIYSGATPNESFCSASEAAAIKAQFGRGVQTTGADGKVTFRTCFPGWYASRTIHIHVRVRLAGALSLTTQFFFADSIADGIVGSAPVYKDRGSRDTTNQNDTVVSAAAAPSYCFDVAQLADGVMQAWKTIVVSVPTDAALCTIPAGSASSSGGGGQGAPDGMPGNAPPASGRDRVR